ncbi:VanW family protein [Irregularibacter muris]|uniref:VanW family protein n=1 Tax=Irregularibacter muris TaxID=1796619 RepID=A0AAE3HI38_9FIRM|nr:VanW family protein [Irregularibacter muris]MCR1899810.1 VanW family protein [Irregularibacter muris]
MKKKLYAILAVAIVLISLLILIPNDVEVNKNIEIDIPDVSGTVNNLPWADNDKFLKAQKENGTHVLMAAYCTVFNDASPSEEFNVHLAANSIAGIVIEPNEVFSQNSAIGPYDEEKGYKAGQSYIGSETTDTVGGGVCKVATTLYNASVYSNLEIVERYNHFMPVSYVPYGQDATVSYGSKDFKFKNNTEFPIFIWAEGIGNRLYISLYGKEKPPSVEWNHKILNRIQASKVYKTNPNLAKGEERVRVEGMEGASVESWVTITNSDGKTKAKHMGISQYWPMSHVVERNK